MQWEGAQGLAGGLGVLLGWKEGPVEQGQEGRAGWGAGREGR